LATGAEYQPPGQGHHYHQQIQPRLHQPGQAALPKRRCRIDGWVSLICMQRYTAASKASMTQCNPMESGP
jgi:hypothetical protein